MFLARVVCAKARLGCVSVFVLFVLGEYALCRADRDRNDAVGPRTSSMVTLAGYCAHSTVVPAIVPKIIFAPSEDIHVKELLLSNGGGCYGKRGKRGT
jgi:hypothetical protein